MGENVGATASAVPCNGGDLYRFKYIHAARTISTTVMIHSDESLIPVFLAMARHFT